jgi:CBS domain-containing protein
MLAIEKTITEFVRDAPFAAIAPDERVSAAMAVMLERKLDCVLVTEAGKPVGIFTEHDFLNKLAANRRDPATTAIAEVMTPNPECLRMNDRMNYAINRMAIRGYRNIPIVDSDGRAISVIDVRVVMLHLLKLFAEVEREGGSKKGTEEWSEIGGGG